MGVQVTKVVSRFITETVKLMLGGKKVIQTHGRSRRAPKISECKNMTWLIAQKVASDIFGGQ